jgi:succinate dehydrogenase / fumarate reductase, flavoprotein subunit
MSDHAGFICPVDEIAGARAAAGELRSRIWRAGIVAASPERAAEPFRWRHMALLSEAVLAALDVYTGADGGSRGARAYCDPSGTELPQAHRVDCSAFRFRRRSWPCVGMALPWRSRTNRCVAWRIRRASSSRRTGHPI